MVFVCVWKKRSREQQLEELGLSYNHRVSLQVMLPPSYQASMYRALLFASSCLYEDSSLIIIIIID